MSKNLNINEVLRKQFELKEFREGQEQVIRQIRRGRDVFARMPTSSGKSLCFQLPAVMESEKTTLVISPLIALMRDQVRGLVSRGISATDFNSSYGPEDRTRILDGIRQKVFRLVYAAPEQLALRDFHGAIEDADIARIAVDEAHCVSQWGHDFRPSYANIAPFADEMEIGQICAFTATASSRVITDVEQSLHMEKTYEYLGNVLRPNLEYRVFQTHKLKEKARELLRMAREYLKQPGGILVYCATRNEVLRVFDFLNRKGLPVGFYHAGMPAEERKTAEQDFYGNRKRVLVATNAFGMGVDKPDIRVIVHFNIPGSIEDYIQQTGRAGRDGRPSECVLLYYPHDKRTQRALLDVFKPQMSVIRIVFAILHRQAQTRGSDGFFDFDFGALESAVMRSRRNSRTRFDSSWKPMVHAAMNCLREFGAVEFQGNRARLSSIEKGGIIEAYIAQRRAEDLRKFEKITEYAESKEPTQQLLINLLEAT